MAIWSIAENICDERGGEGMAPAATGQSSRDSKIYLIKHENMSF
jgi:hypothetical protein